jgi:uncharacterized damage-inducible protein DinB
LTSTTLDPFLVRYAPGSATPVAPILLAARTALGKATADLLTVPDAALEAPWPWRGRDADVRYGFYRVLELLEDAAVSTVRARSEGDVASPATSDLRRTRAGDLIALATAARWDLHGRLASFGDEPLDRDPGGGEWTLRRTLAHIVNGQRAYGWFTAWWVSQGITDPAALPARVPEAVAAELPDEETEAEGPLEEIRQRIDAVVDGSSEALGGLTDAELALGARWSGYPVTVGFRIGRWSSHLREHTVQVDKTLAAVGWRPSEVDRLLALIHDAYGRLESLVFGLPAAALEAPGADGRSAARIIEGALAESAQHARETRESAARAVTEQAAS